MGVRRRGATYIFPWKWVGWPFFPRPGPLMPRRVFTFFNLLGDGFLPPATIPMDPRMRTGTVKSAMPLLRSRTFVSLDSRNAPLPPPVHAGAREPGLGGEGGVQS